MTNLDNVIAEITLVQALSNKRATRFELGEAMEAVVYVRTRITCRSAGVKYLAVRYGLSCTLARKLYKEVCSFFDFGDTFSTVDPRADGLFCEA